MPTRIVCQRRSVLYKITLNKNIQDILYFKGIIDFNKDYVKLDITDKKDNQSNWNVILSVLK